MGHIYILLEGARRQGTEVTGGRGTGGRRRGCKMYTKETGVKEKMLSSGDGEKWKTKLRGKKKEGKMWKVYE